MSAAVEIEDLRFAYAEGLFALAVDRLVIDRRERVACIGPSGCGKTTLAHLIAGILSPDRGRIVVGGQVVSSLGERARRYFRLGSIGLVFQEFELLDYLSVEENILLPYYLSPALTLTRAVRDRARGLAASSGIDHAWRRRPRRLSQGERQRVAVCRALVTEPDLLICDEPTGNLDPSRSVGVIELILEHAHEHGAAVLCVTHNHALLDRFDRTLDMAGFGVVERASSGVSA